MNNTDNSLVIPANKAQDLLNVDVTPGGRSVKKRKGYGLSATLSVSTSPVHGIYNFFDANGNSVDLYFNDSRMTSSVNGSAATVLFSTGSNAATYQCVDSQGFAYCNNTARTTLTKTDGATYSSIKTVNSTGTLIAVTQERLVTAGFSEAPNRVDLSKASDFATWTVGAQNTDPVQFTIVSPGSHLTHIVYAFGRIIWFKDSSFGYILEGETQADWQIRIVSPNVGTLDNSSIYREGILYFRGQDGHIYGFDGSNYQKMTRDIQGTISGSQSRRNDSWTQTILTDWQAGTFSPSSGNFTVDGSITAKGWQRVVTSSTDWAGGTFDNTVYVDTETSVGNIQTVFPETFDSYRTGASSTKNVWTEVQPSGFLSAYAVSGGTLTMRTTQTNGSACSSGSTGDCDSFIRTTKKVSALTASTGTTYYFKVAGLDQQDSSTYANPPSGMFFLLNPAARDMGNGSRSIVDASLDNPNGPAADATSNSYFAVVFNSTVTASGDCVWIAYRNSGDTSGTRTVKYFTTNQKPTHTFTFPFTATIWLSTSAFSVTVNSTLISSGTQSWSDAGNSIYAYEAEHMDAAWSSPNRIDDFTVSPETFTFTSASLDTSISSPTWGTFTATTGGTGSIGFTSQVSADNSSFDSAVTATSGSSLTSAMKRYVKLNAAFNYAPTSFPGAAQSLSDFTPTAYSTGTFYSQVKNASTLSAWDSLTATKQDNGGSNTFYIRAATYSFSGSAATPAWTSISAGAVPSISTGAYFQIRDDIAAISSTTLASLNDFTQNWFEGSATDKAYAMYFNDALWWSVASGTGATTNNRILKYDFLNADWDLYDIPANGMLVRNNSLYFGSATDGKIFKFGDVDNDNGAAINAYWKSKDFFGDSPFVDKEIVNLSVSADSVANSSMTVTYTLNGANAAAYTVNLYDPNKTIIRSNRPLPQGKIGNTFNVQFGNNAADQPFEMFAIQYGVREKPWIPTP